MSASNSPSKKISTTSEAINLDSTPELSLDEKNNLQLEREYNKLLSRNEELVKQLTLIRKIYTTLLRKKSSLLTVMELIDEQKNLTTIALNDLDKIDNLLISEEAIKFIPELSWYNNQITELVQSNDMNSLTNYDQITDKLIESYNIYKETSLIYNTKDK